MGLAARDSRFAPRSQGPRRLLKAEPKPTPYGCYEKCENFWTLPLWHTPPLKAYMLRLEQSLNALSIQNFQQFARRPAGVFRSGLPSAHSSGTGIDDDGQTPPG